MFTKPLEAVTQQDLEDLCTRQFPENQLVEFKGKLPAKNGHDKWHDGIDDVGPRARDEVLSEIIAFANTQGGSLVLGIDQADGNPPRASGIAPIRNCHDLAQRFENMAIACIDPPLPLLHIRGIETNELGGGVVLWRIEASRNAPHRLQSDGQCYIRRGTVCHRMSMREIQELTLRRSSAGAEIDQLFESHRASFEYWLVGAKTGSPPAVGARVTAIPASPMPPMGRLFDHQELIRGWTDFRATIGGAPIALVYPGNPGRPRPILRGCRVEASPPCAARVDIHEDGIINFQIRAEEQAAGSSGLFLTWLAWIAANALSALDHYRSSIGAPDVEYEVEIECARCKSTGRLVDVPIFGWFGGASGGAMMVQPGPLLLPRYSVGGRGEFDNLINLIVRDTLDATQTISPDQRLNVEW